MNIYSDRYKISLSYHKGWNTVQFIYEQMKKEQGRSSRKNLKAST
jgi:hypothetical protein